MIRTKTVGNLRLIATRSLASTFLFIGATIASLCLLFAATERAYANSSQSNAKSQPTSSSVAPQPLQYSKKDLTAPLPRDQILGCSSAEHTIIEYSSYVCPHCSYYHANVFPAIKEEFIDTCKVRYIYREYPLKHAGLDAAVLVRCGISDNQSPKDFYDFANVLFASQRSWAFDTRYRDRLKELAKLQGMSDARFESCLLNSEIGQYIVNVAYQASSHFSINEIPYLMFDGKKIDGHTIESIRKAFLNAQKKFKLSKKQEGNQDSQKKAEKIKNSAK